MQCFSISRLGLGVSGRPLSTAQVAASAPRLLSILASSATKVAAASSRSSPYRLFSTSSTKLNWLTPKSGAEKGGKSKKGRPRVCTGGSTRGTTVVWGDYGLRLMDRHRRLSALQLRNGEETIKKKLRGMKFRLYMRIAANIPVYTKGNESRMGTGKGNLDYWSARVPVSRIIFELKGEIHEKVAREAFRLAANKMPGEYEFVKKGDVPVMGITKMTPEFIEKLRNQKANFPLKKFLPPPEVDGQAMKDAVANPNNPI
ncbi:ribosomal protein L10e/L16 [Kalaharituber pfeilii]|nr:ribosomal protein L10e/L16 [Kalaharituber pfeilii]